MNIFFFQGNTGLPGERGETGPRVNIELPVIICLYKHNGVFMNCKNNTFIKVEPSSVWKSRVEWF